MKRSTTLALPFLGLFAAWASVHSQETPGTEFRWRTELASALDEAKRAERPLLVVFR